MATRAASEHDHPYHQVRWQNFRGFVDTGWITLKPLTILIGANSAGKSSVLSPLLMLNQTLASRDGVTPLVTRGPLVDAGNFRDIIHCGDISRTLHLGFRFHVHQGTADTPLWGYPPGVLEIALRAGDAPNQVVLQQLALRDIILRPLLSKERKTSGDYGLSGLSETKMSKYEKKVVRAHSPMNFLFSSNSAVYDLRELTSGKDESAALPPFTVDFSKYISAMSFTFEVVSATLSQMSYIGPLRERPKRHYEVSGEIPRTVGYRGENTANLLRQQFSSISGELDYWSKAFEFGDRISIKNFEDDLFSIVLESDDPPFRANIADAGFGASQLLPLLVQALSAPETSLTFAEQPEIHLNPRLQTVLADLFVEMATRDRRVVVETHSEHMITRLRRLVAEGKIENDQIAIYFVERDGNVSSVREIPVEDTGHIDPSAWPKGFFAESLREALALATAQGSRKKKTVRR